MRRLGFAAVCLASALVYAPSLRNGLLHWDDDRIVAGDPFLQHPSLAGLVDFFAHVRNEAYQPLHRLSYWLDVPWAGLDPRVLHATNVLLWALAAGVWFLVLCRSGRSPLASALATLWVALHPIQVEAVTWVTGRKDALALLFVGLACLAFCARRYAWSSVAYACAVLSKTTSLPLPLVFVAFEVFERRQRLRAALRTQWFSLATMALLGGLLVVIWQTHELVRPTDLNRALLSAATLGHYVQTAVWPWPLSPLHPIWYTPADIPVGVWLGLGALIAAAVLWKAWRFSLLAFVLLLVPVLNLVPLYFQTADRYLSLPLLALSWGLAHSLERRVARVAVLLSLLVFAGLDLRYQPAWASDVTLWSHATQAEPRAYYAWIQLGHARRDAGDHAGAVQAYEQAISVQPRLSLGHTALFYAVVQHEVADPAEGKQLFSRYQSALSQPQLLDALVSELITRDARNSAALAFRRLITAGLLTPDLQPAALAAARASDKPWVAAALQAAIDGNPASANLR